MTTIYVVEQGEYSDCRICGIYSTKENAQVRIDASIRADDYDTPRWYEMELDKDIEIHRQDVSGWQVTMTDNGEVEFAHSFVPYKEYSKEFTRSYHGFLLGSCLAMDEVTAIKIINDRRLAMKASGTLPPFIK